MRTATQNGGQGILVLARHGRVTLQDLGVAQDAVERRTQLVRQPGDVAAFRRVGGFRRFLGLLQGFVGLAVGFDLLHQQQGLPIRLLLRHAAAFAGQYQPPGEHGSEQREGQKGLEESLVERLADFRFLRQQAQRDLAVDQRQRAEQHQHQQTQQAQVLRQAAVQTRDGNAREEPADEVVELIAQACSGFAAILAARVERTTQ